jgi:hypothetical protein
MLAFSPSFMEKTARSEAQSGLCRLRSSVLNAVRGLGSINAGARAPFYI